MTASRPARRTEGALSLYSQLWPDRSGKGGTAVDATDVLRRARRAAWRGRLTVLAAAALPVSGLGIGAAQSAAAAPTAPVTAAAPAVTLPDMQVRVKTSAISIGTDTTTGRRQLQFSHLTWDAGKGPFEIDPNYDSATGTATFTQVIYNSPRPGVWHRDHTVSLGFTGTFDPPTDYRFPLGKFTLNKVTARGGVGAAVATSPKADYCMTGDTFVGDVPNTPQTTFIPQNDCADPTRPLGWSVGWGDEYDQTDEGQPIDLPAGLNGTFILQGTVDPDHLLTESNRNNDVVDTKLTISGRSVTVLSQTRPGVTPPKVSLTSPKNGAKVKGTVTLRASASTPKPARVSSVQFLLDGRPLGKPVKSAPYHFAWHIGSTLPGRHSLSARVTDSRGDVATAAVHGVTVLLANPNGLSIDAHATKTGTGTVVLRGFSTILAGDTLAAFAGSDGPAGAAKQAVTVSGGGLTWKRVRQADARSGDAEIWTAHAARRLAKVAITFTPRAGGFALQGTVVAFRHSAGLGASTRASASAASGAPRITLTTQAAGSLSYAVGADWDKAIARKVGPHQALISQWVNTASADTYWVQGTTGASSGARKKVTLNDTAPTADQWNLAAVEVRPARSAKPAASLVNPADGQTVSGIIPVAAAAQADVAIASARFFLDGRPLGPPVTTAPYAIRWNTRTATRGRHVLSARVTDVSGDVGSAASVPVRVQNPAPPQPCFIMDAQRSAHGRGTVTTPPLHTAEDRANGGELLLAFVSSAGPAGPHQQSVRVRGAGLTWTLVRRVNARSGDAEIWTATANSVLAAARVTSTPARPGYRQTLTVIAMQGTGGTAASAGASAAGGHGRGGPSVKLATAKVNSLIFAVGTSRGGAAAGPLPTGWTALNQWRSVGHTGWSQYTNWPVARAGTQVTVTGGTPAARQWNLAAVVVPGDDD
jgi:hypothetical protein